MFKKISALCLAAAMLLGTAPVRAARLTVTDSEEQLLILQALGVTKELPYSMSEGVFVKYLAGLMYDGNGMSAAEFAKMTGMAEKLDETKRITYETALKYAVIALGYKVQGESSGYTQTAASLKLTDNIALGESAALTGNAAGQLLINMLDAEPLRRGYENGGIIYKTATGETLLSLNRDIVKIEGIVTANSVTGLTELTGAGDGKIAVGGTVYETDGDFDDLLGKTVYGFLKKDSSDDTVIFLHEKSNKNNILELGSELLVDFDGSQIRYKEDAENSTMKRAKLSNTVRVIYNGAFFGSYTDADLIPANGSVTLIDNDNDRVYDVAMVTSYATMVVAGKTSEKEKIVNAYQFASAVNTIELDLSNEDNRVKIYGKDGSEIKFADIASGDVLSIAESRSATPKIITVYKSDSVLQGNVTAINNDDKIITVGESEFSFIDELILDNSEAQKALNTGSTYKFYFDYFGNIVYMKYINELDYYIFYKVQDLDGEYAVQYMDINEDWIRAPLAKRVTVGTDSGMTREAAFQTLNYHQPEVAKMYFNANGELKEIQFAKASAVADENKFTKRSITSTRYRSIPKCFEGKIWLEDDAMVYILPSNLSNKSGYGVQKASAAFSESVTAGYAVTAYDFDKYGFTSLLSQNDGDNGKALEKSLFLVTQVLTICVDGEILSCVKGVCGDFIVYQMTGESSSTFAGIKAGDVIRVHTNREGRVDSVSTPISTDENRFVKKLWNITDNTGTYNNGNVATGFISEIDHSEKKIMIDAGEDAVFRLTDSIVVSIYSRSAKTCERGSIADLTVGDMVVCKNSYLQLQEIIVARD